jgi:phage major head subunit gpT-like protein
MVRLNRLTPLAVRAALAKERRNDREAAKVLVSACKTGDVDLFLYGVDLISNVSIDGWQLALAKVAKLTSVSDEIKSAFLDVWIQSKHLPLACGNRRATDSI